MEQEIKEAFRKLENRIDKIKKSKDHWDKIAILFSALIPLAIASTGYYFSNSQKLK